jgi:hypothetical protein
MPLEDYAVHTNHCCVRHGCKYCAPNCPVETKVVKQLYNCEDCLDWKQHGPDEWSAEVNTHRRLRVVRVHPDVDIWECLLFVGLLEHSRCWKLTEPVRGLEEARNTCEGMQYG